VTIEKGLHAYLRHEVTPDDTARAIRSGDLDVLGTPRLLAWCEEAAVAALAETVEAARTTVSVRVELAHERASAVGAVVAVRADLVHVDGRLLRFDVVAEQESGDGTTVVARGQMTRVVVDRARFLARL